MSDAAGSTMPASGALRDSWRLRSTRTAVALTAVLVLGPACSGPSNQPAVSHSDATPWVRLSPPHDPAGPSTIDLVGLPADDLSALRAAALTPDEWTALFRVSVESSVEDMRSRPAVLGTYSVSDDAIHFRPLYSFDPGRRYRVVFAPSRLPPRSNVVNSSWRSRQIEATVSEPAANVRPTARVVRVHPTAEEIPENQLRLYIYFSAPMGLKGGAEQVRLLDEGGRVVEDAFLPLDVDLWNADRTRYTLLFDPGRVKRGIPPNDRLGRPIASGRTYTLVIDREWRDAYGLPLVESFSRQFRVGAPNESAIDLAEWRLAAPVAGTRDPLVVSFPRPLDYALLQRALVVATDRGALVSGAIDIEAGETRWMFTPREPWRVSEYRLVALPVLEDPAGNRVGRPFEVVPSEGTTTHGEGREASVPFSVTPSRR